MARLNVTPTRMELSRLKDQLATSIRGHKLLKDKQDELVRRFIELVRGSHALRLEVEEELAGIMQETIIASAPFPEEIVDNSFYRNREGITVDITEANLMGFAVPVMEFSKQVFADKEGVYAPSPEIAEMASRIRALMPKLLQLAEIEKTCVLLAKEIEKVRRRVNALEYMTIPQLQETIRYIRMKLEDNERESIIRMIKGKDFHQ